MSWITAFHGKRNGFYFLYFLVVFLAYLIAGNRVMAQDIYDPPALYAVWTSDPTTSLSIIWNTRDDVSEEVKHPPILEYRLRNNEKGNWKQVESRRNPLPFSNRIIHRADLSHLRPDTEYSFRLDSNARVYYFLTMPAKLNRPVRFAAGGDTKADEDFEKTNIEAMKHDPDFIMFGGDLAYENGSPKLVDRVFSWMEIAKKTFIREDGRIIPIIASIGDHEGRRAFPPGYFERLEDEAPYYYAMFPFPGVPGYGVLDVSDYLSIVVLQAGFGAKVEGKQTQWLEKTLRERGKVPHIFPLYHHGVYPTIRPVHTAQQKLWAPLFEKYGVRVAFENHDHAYKRTYPIRDGKRVADGEGVVYLGDGSWGQLRTKINAENWYLARALAVRSFIIGTIQPKKDGVDQYFRMYDQYGNLIDSYPEMNK